jgi:hypothetical protein
MPVVIVGGKPLWPGPLLSWTVSTSTGVPPSAVDHPGAALDAHAEGAELAAQNRAV